MVGSTELSLVLFTILVQMSVGAIVFLLITHLTRKEKAFSVDAMSLTRQIVYLSLALTVIGILSSFTHLGHAARAYRALFFHLSSWMGKESLFLGLFFVSLLAYAILLLKGSGPKVGIEFFAAITGFLAVLSSSLVYSVLGSVPSWNNIFSVLFFLITFVLTGASLFAVVIASKLKSDHETVKNLAVSFMRSLSSILVPALAAAILLTGGYLFYLNGRGSEAAASMGYLTGSILFWLRIVAGLVVPLFLLLTLKKLVNKGEIAKVSSYMYGVFILILAGEFLGRVLFYGSSVMHTIGGNGTPY